MSSENKTNSSSSSSSSVGSVDIPKNAARNSRLSYSNKSDREEISEKLAAQAQENCKKYYHIFGECAKENGLLVIFRCKKQNQDILDCFNANYSEEMVDKYMIEKGYK